VSDQIVETPVVTTRIIGHQAEPDPTNPDDATPIGCLLDIVALLKEILAAVEQ